MSLPALRTLIAEDEPPARERLHRLLSAEAGYELVAEATDGHQALKLIRQHQPQILLLDIRLPGLNGFEVLAALGNEALPAVIFVSAHSGHAVRAFDARAVDYLLKPFTKERFRQALQRARVRCESNRSLLPVLQAGIAQPTGRIAFRSGGRSLILPLDEIQYAISANTRCNVHTSKETVSVSESLASFHERLPNEKFVRISRFAVVNLAQVRAVEPKSNGDQHLILHNGTSLILTRTRRAQFLALLGHQA